MGGAGLKMAKKMNRALLAKLYWHVISNRESVWSRLLREKCGMHREDDVHFREKT